MGALAPTHLILILIVALIVFGPKKLPEIGKSLGQGLRELKKATRDITSTLDGVDDDCEPVPSWRTESTPTPAPQYGGDTHTIPTAEHHGEPGASSDLHSADQEKALEAAGVVAGETDALRAEQHAGQAGENKSAEEKKEI